MTTTNIKDSNLLLKKYWGHDKYRKLQEKIITNVLSKKDSLVLLPTGGGKSLCYQLPALMFGGITVVISPLIALMKDQVDALNAKGISAAYINSTLSQNEILKTKQLLEKDKIKILYIAPERYSSEGFRNFLKQLHVSLVAIDEAHCISEWGHDFRPAYRELITIRRDYPSIPIIALTATATEIVRKDIIEQLHLKNVATFISSFDRTNLNYSVVQKWRPYTKLIKLLHSYLNSSIIIYCFSRKDTEELATKLQSDGFAAKAYHAGLENEERKEIQEEFKTGLVNIIVATIAFGMGIDKPNIRLVVHFDLPKSVEGYFQETGRAGRDGKQSDCVLFYAISDKKKQEYFIDQIEDELEKKKATARLQEIINYCETKVCRRMFLLSYFGETYEKENCASCDNCSSSDIKKYDATIITQKILSAIYKTDGFGINHVINVLLGKRTENIAKYKHDRLSVFGIASNHTAYELRVVIRDLIINNFVKRTGGEYPTIAVNKKGIDFLRRKDKIFLPSYKISIPKNKKRSKTYTYKGFGAQPSYKKRIRSKKQAKAFWWEQ